MRESQGSREGVVGVADNIRIYSVSGEDHETNIRNMRIRCLGTGLKLSERICLLKTVERSCVKSPQRHGILIAITAT